MSDKPKQWAVELWTEARRRHDVAKRSPGFYNQESELIAALTIQRAFEERERKLREENARLRKMQVPQWYYADGYSSEDCHDSPDEVIEYLDLKPGKHVVSVDCAGPMPSIWCAVTILTDEQMVEQETDDRVVFTEHASEKEARQALKETPDAG